MLSSSIRSRPYFRLLSKCPVRRCCANVMAAEPYSADLAFPESIITKSVPSAERRVHGASTVVAWCSSAFSRFYIAV